MSDDTAPGHVWVTEGGDLSHHRPSDPTAVQYTRADILASETERLTGDAARLARERDDLANALAKVRAVVEAHDAEPLHVGEPAESIDIGRAQLADEVRAALAALRTETEDYT